MHSSEPHFLQDPKAQAARWHARRLNCDCSVEERKSFLRWLNDDEANRKAYEEVESLWEQLGGLESVAGRQLEEARAHLAAARRKSRSRVGLALAASLVLALAWNTGWFDVPDEHVYRTALGQMQRFTLADGTQLELDTDSEVVVRYTRHRRDLNLLRGQAVFTVAHGDARVFDVHAANALIRDVGTQFVVRKYADRISVAVLAGDVEVSGSGAEGVLPLHQGQQLSYGLQGKLSSYETVDLASTAAWRNRRLVFHGQALGDVLVELARYHAVSFSVTSPRIMALKVSGTFPTDDLALALETMAAAIPVRLTKTGAASWRIDG